MAATPAGGDAWQFMIPQPSAKHLEEAVWAIENRPTTPESEPPACERDRGWRDTFLQICGDRDIYDAVRDLNANEDYWKKEEAHFHDVRLLGGERS
ncbi:hypothetical protein LTR15_010931 [Elasticomyces elasticus]|nr:hypothetical protein LTR15_010931 [Elasticomyces elasticus]